jgi:hypothetical protein
MFFLLMVLAMAIGYILQRKSIAGSCGGLGALGISKACDCPEPCDRKKSRMAREEKRQKKIKEWQDNQIL